MKPSKDNAFAIGVLERLADGEVVPPEDLTELSNRGYRVPLTPEDALFDLSTLDRRQRNLESFFFQLIDLQRQLGIASYLGF